MKIALALGALLLCAPASADECLTYASQAHPAKTLEFTLEGQAILHQPGKPELRYNTAGAGTGIEGRAMIPIDAPASGEMLYTDNGDTIVVEGEVFAPDCD